jgi:hypothetical protein
MPAGQALIAMFIALSTAAMLNAQGMHKTALSQKPGVTRDVAAALSAGLAGISGFLMIDQPREQLKAALGRADDDKINTKVAFAASPKASAVVVRKPAFSSTHPLRLYMTGDSLITDPGPVTLERLASNAAVKSVAETDAHPATGLVQPELFNWFDYLPRQVSHYHPDVTVLTFGANDGLGFTSVAGADEFGSPQWLAEYRRRVAGVMDALTAKRTRVVWLGLPIPRDAGLAARWQKMNEIQRTEAAKRPGQVLWVNLYDLMKDSGGNYSDYLPDASGQPQLARSSDGIHYETEGSNRVAAAIIQALATIAKVPGLKTGQQPGIAP